MDALEAGIESLVDEGGRTGWVNVNEGTNYWKSHLPSVAARAR